MKIKRTCPVCKEEREFDIDEFMKTTKKRVVCGKCQDGVLMTKGEAYEIVYGGYSFGYVDFWEYCE